MKRSVKKDIPELILRGLRSKQKNIPSRFFYDSRGSQLFDEICSLEEYYLTRTEIKILSENIAEISALLGEEILLIEFGSGSSTKTKILIENTDVKGYIPIDISYEHLIESVKNLKEKHPEIKIYPMPADYMDDFILPGTDRDFKRKVVFFPGSTLGNFTQHEAEDFLQKVHTIAGSDGRMILGVDLVKDKRIIEAAYNDRKGVTAEFNLNILNNINKLTGSNFKTDQFEHLAFYNEAENRIEMHLISRTDQCIRINDEEIRIAEGENIITEFSYKYTLSGLKKLLKKYFKVQKIFTDKNNYFAVAVMRT